MTTTDAQGILYLEDTDPITPFQTVFNAAQSATSSAIVAASRGRTIFPAVDEAERLARLAAIGSSADRPLYVMQADTGTLWEHAGVRWRPIGGTPVEVRAVEVAEAQATGPGAALLCPNLKLTLTPGRWQITGSISARTVEVADAMAAEVRVVGGAAVANSRGTSATTSPTQALSIMPRPITVTVTTSGVQYTMAAVPNGGSTIRMVSLAGAPVAWMIAEQVG